MTRAVKESRYAVAVRPIRRAHRRPGALIALTALAILAGLQGTAAARPLRAAVEFQSCLGWGLCVFRRVDAEPSGAAASPAASATLRVRLRGVGDPALQGVCTPERDAARAVRHFVEGILMRAGRVELDKLEPRKDGSVLATVRADGTDVADILVHLGLGREKALAPGATWCD